MFEVSEFPRTSKYNPEWIMAGASGGANPLWLTEWLSSSLDLKPGMRVLDLGCGRALSSIFLHREFGVQVWATDLWFSVNENLQRILDAEAQAGVFPIHADARILPFGSEFFDAIISIDSYIYYGTDDNYLKYLTRLLKPGGQLAIAGAGVIQELDDKIPDHLAAWWSNDMWCMHSAAWWQRHWERSGIVDIEVADTLPDGWRLWKEWLLAIAPDNKIEIEVIESDQGSYLGYVRIVGRRKMDVFIEDPIQSIPNQYIKMPLLRSPRTELLSK